MGSVKIFLSFKIYEFEHLNVFKRPGSKYSSQARQAKKNLGKGQGYPAAPKTPTGSYGSWSR